MNVRLNPREEELLAETVTVDPVAYDFYMKGLFNFTKYTTESFDSAMQCFELAKEIDPDFALAYAGISMVWNARIHWGIVTFVEGNPKAMEALMKAYALDSNNAEVHNVLAYNKTWGMYNWEGGEAGFKKSISLNPNHASTRASYSQLLGILGRHEEGLKQMNIALKLDPKNPLIIIRKGIALCYARKYDEAIKAFNDALDLTPEYPIALWNLWYAYYYAGRTEEAYATYKLCWSMEDPELVKFFEQGYLKDGFRGACLSLADRLEEIWKDHQFQSFHESEMAVLYSIGQETDKSIYWLEQAYKLGIPNLPGLLMMPVLDNVRPDSRFKDLCQRMNLPHAAVTE